MNDGNSDDGFDTLDIELEEFDSAPTQKFETESPMTDPAHAAVLQAEVAMEIRREHEETITEENTLTFVGKVDEEGRIVVSEALRGSVLKPGDELIIRAEKIN